MPLVVWNDHLCVGDTFIDNDHRYLIGLLNELHTAMGEGGGPDALGTVLNDLVRHTREHFEREENLMRSMHYAGYSEHLDAHHRLIKEVLQMQKNYMAGETKLTAELLQFLFERFLSDWLFDHIMTLDKKLAQAIQQAGPDAESRA